MSREVIHTQDAPEAIGVYSQAIKSNQLVFLSGQIGLDPKTLQIVQGGFEAELKQVLRNLTQVVIASGGMLSDLVKLNIYVTDLTNFPVVNKMMEAIFTKPYPARAVVEVSGLPKGALVEIEGTLILS